jgi:hypothetical protein
MRHLSIILKKLELLNKKAQPVYYKKALPASHS